MKVAGEIMTPDPLTISTLVSPELALTTFLSKKLTVMPIVNPAGKVAGLLSAVNLVKIMAAFFQSKTRSEKIANYMDFLVPAHFIRKDDSVQIILREMMISQSSRLLVSDSTEKLLGIISPVDMLKMFENLTKARSTKVPTEVVAPAVPAAKAS